MPLSRLAPASFASALSAAAAALLLAQSADAQQTHRKCPSRMAFRWRQRGLRISRCHRAVHYKTAEQQGRARHRLHERPRVSYSMAFLPTGELLVTERAGRLRIIRNGKLDPKPVSGGPASKFAGKSGAIGAVHGYMTVVAHPQFAQNHWIYFSYTKLLADNSSTDAVARAVLKDGAMSDLKDVWVGENIHGAISILATTDNKLWIATSGEGTAQDAKTSAAR